jgi:hypothetical protein
MKSARTRSFSSFVVAATMMAVMALWVPVGWAQQAPIQTGLVTGSGLPNYIPMWATNQKLGNSVVYQSSSQNVGVGTITPGSKLDVAGDINLSGVLRVLGSPALRFPGGISGFNTGLGFGALQNNTGFNNTASGSGALANNTAGLQNTASGSGALGTNTSGNNNTGDGFLALSNNTIGSLNTACGASALFSNIDGNSNTASGATALVSNTTGSGNTASGANALRNNTTGIANIAIGNNAALNVSGSNSNNIHIGSIGLSGDNATIRIGTPGAQSSFFAAGVAGATVSGAQVLVDTTTGQLGVASSSRRFKEDIRDMADASNGLMRLRPVSFRYEKPFADGSKPVQYGLIAEEVAEVYPDLVAHSADGQIETVKYQVLDSMLLNEVQRQQTEIHGLERQNQDLRERLSRLEAALNALTVPKTQ